MSEQQSEDPKMTRAIRAAILIRSKRDELKKEYDEAFNKVDAPLKDQYDKLRLWITNQLNQVGQGVRTEAGTAFFKEVEKAKIVDWLSFSEYVRSTGDLDLLEHRASKTAVQQHIEDSQGEVPPGIHWDVERVLNLRKPTNPKK